MKKIFACMSKRLSKRPVKMVGLFSLALLLLVPGVALVRLDTGNDTLIKPSTSVYKDNQSLESAFGGQSIVVMYTTPDMNKFLSVDNLTKLQEFETIMSHTDGVYSVLSPATAVEQISVKQSSNLQTNVGDMDNGLHQMANKLRGMSDSLSGQAAVMADQLDKLASGLATVQSHASNLTPSIPQDPANLHALLYDQNGKLRNLFENTVVDNHHVLAMVRLNGDLNDNGKQYVIQQINQFTNATPLSDATVMVTGKPVLDNALHAAMKDSMRKMIALAIVIMFVVLSLIFQVRWRIIALPLIFVGVAGTLGLMGYVGIPMTMVSMAVFPILIGLGVDYAIQFQNRYEEEIAREGLEV